LERSDEHLPPLRQCLCKSLIKSIVSAVNCTTVRQTLLNIRSDERAGHLDRSLLGDLEGVQQPGHSGALQDDGDNTHRPHEEHCYQRKPVPAFLPVTTGRSRSFDPHCSHQIHTFGASIYFICGLACHHSGRITCIWFKETIVNDKYTGKGTTPAPGIAVDEHCTIAADCYVTGSQYIQL
jgi:hypothetical protein